MVGDGDQFGRRLPKLRPDRGYQPLRLGRHVG
jgi:hypothetical protein